MKTNTKITLKVLSYFTIIAIPVISFAALEGLKDLLKSFVSLLNTMVPVLFGLSMIFFLWGVAQFILNDAGNEKSREEGKNKMIWGIVALFVFVSIFGILKFVGDTLQIQPGGNMDDVFNRP